MPQTGFIDGSAPPFIMLAIAFATLPLLYNLVGETARVAQSRYRQYSKGLIIASMIPYFLLGVELLIRIYLNGDCNSSTQGSKEIFCRLDFIIILTTAICFVLAFLLMWWYFFYLRWYRRFLRYATVVLPSEKDQGFGEGKSAENIETGEKNKNAKPDKNNS